MGLGELPDPVCGLVDLVHVGLTGEFHHPAVPAPAYTVADIPFSIVKHQEKTRRGQEQAEEDRQGPAGSPPPGSVLGSASFLPSGLVSLQFFKIRIKRHIESFYSCPVRPVCPVSAFPSSAVQTSSRGVPSAVRPWSRSKTARICSSAQ